MQTRSCENTPEKHAVHNGISKQIQALCAAHPRSDITMLTLPAGQATFERMLFDNERYIIGDTDLQILGYELDKELYDSCVRATIKYPRLHVHNMNVMHANKYGKIDVVWLDWMGYPDIQKMSFGVSLMNRAKQGLLYATYSARLCYGLEGLRERLAVNGANVMECVHNRMALVFSAMHIQAKRVFSVSYKNTGKNGKRGNPMIMLGYQTGAQLSRQTVPEVANLAMAGAL